jgi:hypothetical protein
MAQDVLRQQFAGELQAGRLQWLEVDFDEARHVHYKQDYELVTSSIVVVRRTGGADAGWQRLDEVWTLVHEEPEFRAYVRDAIARSLAAR